MSLKVIVTNWSVLDDKYGKSAGRIATAIKALIKADKARGVETRLVKLDDAKQMATLKAPPVVKPKDPKQNKAAIDGVFAALTPDYLVLLGSIDVIPHQDLRNPIADGDRCAWSDLPYACDAPYSRKITDFVGPTRVVGRLPDLTGSNDVKYLLTLLKVATTWKSLPASKYETHLGVSAKVWEASTKQSLHNLFGTAAVMHCSPKKGPEWARSEIGAFSHFMNLHGAPADPHFYGQRGSSHYPIAHSAEYCEGKISDGTVATVECCYGAELYDPAAAAGQMGICNTYLDGGAYGFFGSSTIAYGPPVGNGQADLICQYFLKHVFAGASLGRAALQARHDFVQAVPIMNNADEKTLAQFNLIGDPSIHAVQVAQPAVGLVAKTVLTTLASVGMELLAGRSDRRRNLEVIGEMIGVSTCAVVKTAKPKIAAAVRRTLKQIAQLTGFPTESLETFRVRAPKAPALKKSMAAKTARETAFHVLTERKQPKKAPIEQVRLLIAKEAAGKIVSYEEIVSR